MYNQIIIHKQETSTIKLVDVVLLYTTMKLQLVGRSFLKKKIKQTTMPTAFKLRAARHSIFLNLKQT